MFRKFFQNTSDDINNSYQIFLEDMTNEIIKLNLNTNKASTNVFQKNIKHNIGKLEKVFYINLKGGIFIFLKIKN